MTLKYYAWIQTLKKEETLSDFSRIVVRHVCHPGGEGEDTYTGSVGLKPAAEGRAIIWVKDFPGDQDGFSHEAYEFADNLQRLTGLPWSGKAAAG